MLHRISLFLTLTVGALSPVRAAEFKAGAAQVDITPPIGIPLAGDYRLNRSVGVLEPIHAKAIVVEQDGVKIALAAVDLVTVARSVVLAARQLITEQTGIAGERVMISATHTHSGPVQMMDSIRDDLTGANSPEGLEYTGKLPALIARAVADANAKLAPARASAALGREENLSFNRRYVMADGSVAWMVKMNPDIVRPAGLIDPDVGVWHLTTDEKTPEPLATYVNFAMHPTVVGGKKISPDYPGSLARRLADYQGPSALTFFANGCCGNLNQVNPNWAGPQFGPRAAERIGTVLAAAVFRGWPNLRPMTTWAPRARSEVVTLPRPKFTEAEIAEARRIGAHLTDAKHGVPLKAKTVCILDTIAKAGVPLEAEVQAVALSDELAIVGLPGEIFVELGLALKKASPFKHTFIAELANGSIGYVPNRSAYPEGNYEVVSARCAEGSGEMLIAAALKLLHELAKPEQAPPCSHPPNP